MKQVITFVALIFFSLSSSAQSGTDLEFSRTINEPLYYNQSITLGPVPSGKVWKLVGYAGGVRIRLNNNPASILFGPSYSTQTVPNLQLPIFFNESDLIEFSSLENSASAAYVSIIEYTVIP